MNVSRAVPCPVLAGALLGLSLVAPDAAAQGDVRVAISKIQDSRSRYETNDASARLTLFPKLEGAGLAEARGYRLTVTGAKDDLGNLLAPDPDGPTKWTGKPDGMELWLKLAGPARGASTVTLAGTVEAWIPSRDPASEVKIEKFTAKAGKPLAEPALKALKVRLTVLPRDRVNEGSVVVVGPVADMENLIDIAVLRADGTLMESSGRGSQSNDEEAMMEVGHGEAIPADATLVLTFWTDKAVFSYPFETTIPLP
ncbi:MAG: hypothetical protein KJ062_01940 [Thermoanaerobaculia bacterium]|nr:hypothetical protein [Thermoanaerobaculia bacterium]